MLLFVVRPAGCSESIRDPLQNHKHTVAVIPARYASTRFPGKALADIAGRPMIEHVYGRAAAARNVDAVIVATDDRAHRRRGQKFGGDVRMTRSTHQRAPIESPKWLRPSTATSSSTPGRRTAHRARHDRRSDRALSRRCGAPDDDRSAIDLQPSEDVPIRMSSKS